MSVRQYLTEQYILYKVQNGEIEIKVLREICKQKLKVSHIVFQKSLNKLIENGKIRKIRKSRKEFVVLN